MKKVLIALLFMGCVTAPEYTFDGDLIELTGYVANRAEPVTFASDSTLNFVYDYDERNTFNDRVVRTIIVRKQDGKLYFIASK